MYDPVNALRTYQMQDREMAARDQDRAMRNQLAQLQFAASERQRQQQNMLAQAQLGMGRERLGVQREGMGARERLMREQIGARERAAQQSANKPIWDSSRGVFIQPPGAAQVGGQGGVITPEGLPKTQKQVVADKEKEKTMETYLAAREGLLSGLKDTETGPFVGMLPAMTSKQQVGEGAVAAMAPVLKQIFRVAGEGTFTDKDQELLMNMVPTRSDRPEARKAKIENIDRIISAKMGMPIPGTKGTTFDDPEKEKRYQEWKAKQGK